MTLERNTTSDGRVMVSLVTCPKCDVPLDTGAAIRYHLLNDHTAAEWFGDERPAGDAPEVVADD